MRLGGPRTKTMSAILLPVRGEGRARARDPEKERRYQRVWRLRRAYGLSEADLAALLEKQHGACAICGRQLALGVARMEPGGAKIDHCHQSNAVRGLLCSPCNTG